MLARETPPRKKALMILGTASNAGKSTIALGLLRWLRQQGRSAAPFKAMNITDVLYHAPDGVMSRGQAAQCEAAGIPPTCRANPCAMSLSNGKTSLYVNGKQINIQSGAEYNAKKAELKGLVTEGYAAFSIEHEIMILEGAGSPVELNLNQDDFINGGLAEIADANILLVGDIRLGGIFASLYGTVTLLDKDIRKRVRGLIVNRFIGDPTGFAEGVQILAELTEIPVLGVVPNAPFDLEAEDCMSDPASDKNRLPAYREKQYDALAAHLTNHLDMTAIEALLPFKEAKNA